MTTFSTQRIIDFMMDIQSVNAENYEVAVKVREFHFNCDPALTEDIKYGGLVFFREKELMTGIFFYKEHMSIEFGQGASLADPIGVLEGKGKFRRHIKVKTLDDLTTKNVSQYLEAALAL